jgi:ATP-binding cassette subfamily B protein
MNRSAIVKRLNIFMRPLYGAMAFSILMRVMNLMSATVLIAVAAGTLGFYIADPGAAVIWAGIGWMTLAAMKLGLFHYLEQYTGHYIAFRLLAQLRNDFYDKMVPLAPAGFANLRSGDAIARAINDVERIEPYYAHFVAPVFAAVIVPAIQLWILTRFHPSLALALLPFLLVMGLIVPVITDRLGQKPSHKAREMLGEVNAHMTDSLQGLREAVVFGYGKRRRKEVWARGEQMRDAQDKLIGADAIQRGLTEALMAGAVIAVLAVGLNLVQGGQLDLLRELPIVMAIVLTSFTALSGITNAINDFNTAMISAERVYSLMDQVPTVADTGGVHPEKIDSAVSFENVRFKYSANGAPDILDNLSFSVASGRSIALVGESGAGKSTVVNLLMRFWDCGTGDIKIGGHEIKSLPLKTLRDQIAVVSQRTYIFNTTIGENIRLARPDATDQEIAEAARRANLSEFIDSLPEGFDFEVGEMGSKLSGGQRQRVAIARALLKDAPILILDEATSNLDVETERDVKIAIDELTKERTTLVIAHRLSAVVDADEIMVLKDGSICETGKHQELLDKNGIYARLFELQQDEIDAILEEGGE